MNKNNESEPKWDVKVSSKGQITLPKRARDLMMVREGVFCKSDFPVVAK